MQLPAFAVVSPGRGDLRQREAVRKGYPAMENSMTEKIDRLIHRYVLTLGPPAGPP